MINEIPITGLVTFSATESEGGYLSGKAVKVISTFTGHFHGLDTSGNQRVSGSYKQEIDYEDGSGVKCTSGAVAWSATFDSQGNQEAAKPRPGSYTGSYLTFNVSPDSSHIQNVSKQYVTLNCSSGTTLSYQIVINEIPIVGLTTFSATESESGIIIGGKAVKIISTFTGHFHGLATSGNQRVSGSYKQEIDYEEAGGAKCTSGAVAWSATS